MDGRRWNVRQYHRGKQRTSIFFVSCVVVRTLCCYLSRSLCTLLILSRYPRLLSLPSLSQALRMIKKQRRAVCPQPRYRQWARVFVATQLGQQTLNKTESKKGTAHSSFTNTCTPSGRPSPEALPKQGRLRPRAKGNAAESVTPIPVACAAAKRKGSFPENPRVQKKRTVRVPWRYRLKEY